MVTLDRSDNRVNTIIDHNIGSHVSHKKLSRVLLDLCAIPCLISPHKIGNTG